MLRLTGGRWNRRLLQSPKGKEIRPTTARVRQSLFERLRLKLYDAKVLDLFAGTGLISFEALSRGAASSIAVELDAQPVALIKANIATLALTIQQMQVLQADVVKGFKGQGTFLQEQLKASAPFDFIYLDPPYALQEGMAALLATLLSKQWLAEEGVLVLEQGKGAAFPLAVPPSQTLSYGDTTLFWFDQGDLSSPSLPPSLF